MGLAYDNLALKSHKKTMKSDRDKDIERAVIKGFPDCKGTYPDCPDEPKKGETPCRTCPILEEILEKENE